MPQHCILHDFWDGGALNAQCTVVLGMQTLTVGQAKGQKALAAFLANSIA